MLISYSILYLFYRTIFLLPHVTSSIVSRCFCSHCHIVRPILHNSSVLFSGVLIFGRHHFLFQCSLRFRCHMFYHLLKHFRYLNILAFWNLLSPIRNSHLVLFILMATILSLFRLFILTPFFSFVFSGRFYSFLSVTSINIMSSACLVLIRFFPKIIKPVAFLQLSRSLYFKV